MNAINRLQFPLSGDLFNIFLDYSTKTISALEEHLYRLEKAEQSAMENIYWDDLTTLDLTLRTLLSDLKYTLMDIHHNRIYWQHLDYLAKARGAEPYPRFFYTHVVDTDVTRYFESSAQRSPEETAEPRSPRWRDTADDTGPAEQRDNRVRRQAPSHRLPPLVQMCSMPSLHIIATGFESRSIVLLDAISNESQQAANKLALDHVGVNMFPWRVVGASFKETNTLHILLLDSSIPVPRYSRGQKARSTCSSSPHRPSERVRTRERVGSADSSQSDLTIHWKTTLPKTMLNSTSTGDASLSSCSPEDMTPDAPAWLEPLLIWALILLVLGIFMCLLICIPLWSIRAV